MDDEDSTDVATFTAISAAGAAPNDCELIDDRLPMLCARPISVCRWLVLEQAIQTLGFSMQETTTHDDESNEILTAIRINVPPHIRVARMKTRLFHGDWSLTSDAAIQSACYNALVYLQKVKLLTIDGIHSAELELCQRELLTAKSWAEAFENHAKKLQLALPAIVKEKTPVPPIPRTPVKVDLILETNNTKRCTIEELLPPSGPTPVSAMKQKHTDQQLSPPSGSTSVCHMKQKCTDENLLVPAGSPPVCAMKQSGTDEEFLPPSGSTQIRQNVGSKKIPTGVPFVNLSNKTFTFHPNCARLLRRQKIARISVPHPVPALAASNRKKRKLIIGLQRSRANVAALPSLPLLDGSSSDSLDTAATYHSDETTNHIDPKCTVTPLATPPSISKTIAYTKLQLGSRTDLIDSKIRKSMFQDDGDEGIEVDLGEQMLEKTRDFAKIYEAVKETSVHLESTTGPAPLPADKKRESETTEDAADTPAKKIEP